jgi:cytochrome P450
VCLAAKGKKCSENSGNAAQFADYQRLPYARAVIDETLRLDPPAWLITFIIKL